MKKPHIILMDIEGTTTSIDFVHKVLFPYSYEHMDRFLADRQHDLPIKEYLNQAAILHEQRTGEKRAWGEIGSVLKEWIKADLKATPLKAIQGVMWAEGYRAKHFVSHVYEDVPPAWQAWRDQGIGLAIYSSGSVAAQKLLFGHTPYGDLNRFLSQYFDTEIGHKREISSYIKIAAALQNPAGSVLFLSDIVEELEASAEAGMSVVHVVREDTTPNHKFSCISNFSELTFS